MSHNYIGRSYTNTNELQIPYILMLKTIEIDNTISLSKNNQGDAYLDNSMNDHSSVNFEKGSATIQFNGMLSTNFGWFSFVVGFRELPRYCPAYLNTLILRVFFLFYSLVITPSLPAVIDTQHEHRTIHCA